ncbi:hypothetical protein K8R43_04930 [archaeon]|nr:hypothetical protein [archaeon]
MDDEIGVKSFGVLAVLALLFAVVNVLVVLYLQEHAGVRLPNCGDCQYLAGGKCFDYECCEDEHCLTIQTCRGHICYDLDCPLNKTENHACVYQMKDLLIRINQTNVSNISEKIKEIECLDPSDCLDNQTCENNKCVKVECEPGIVIYNHTCTGKACINNIDCEQEDVCIRNICTPLECGTCQYPANHTCINYECCDYTDCGFEETCEEHSCKKLNCTGKTIFFAGKCVTPECSEDSECEDGINTNKDTCLDPGKPYARCTHEWKIANFTGDATLTLNLNQTAYNKGKNSRITFLDYKEDDNYFWTDRAKIDFSLWGQHREEWIIKPPGYVNTTYAAIHYWQNITINGQRITIIMDSVEKSTLKAKLHVKYYNVTG